MPTFVDYETSYTRLNAKHSFSLSTYFVYSFRPSRGIIIRMGFIVVVMTHMIYLPTTIVLFYLKLRVFTVIAVIRHTLGDNPVYAYERKVALPKMDFYREFCAGNFPIKRTCLIITIPNKNKRLPS